MSRTLAVLALAVVVGAEARAQGIATVDIPYQKFVLDNGLTLVVHEDHKAPIVAVNVWYHVGAKNERAGKTGFAHLFEHLMFNGSEHYNDDYFKVLERLGATDLNGTTNNDRTNYFQNVPVSALDTVLWMESDRMGHLLGVIDQPRLDEQRGVVQNEKRQGENQPYGQVFNMIQEAPVLQALVDGLRGPNLFERCRDAGACARLETPPPPKRREMPPSDMDRA